MSDPDSYATSLLVIVVDTYGTDAFEWSPQTISMELEEDYNVAVPQVNIDKIMAAITILTTDDFFTSLPKFIRICNVLADNEFDPTVFDPADTVEIAWALTEAVLLRGSDDIADEPFTEEIRFYIGHMLNQEGIVNPPDILKLALRDLPLEDPLSVAASDPEMYQGFYENQASKSDEIQNTLRIQIAELVNQLASMQLANGKAENVLSLLSAAN